MMEVLLTAMVVVIVRKMHEMIQVTIVTTRIKVAFVVLAKVMRT